MKNIVILRTDRIGEVLLSTVVIDAVKGSYPEAGVSFVTSDYSRPIIESREDVNDTLTVDTMNKGGWLLKSFKLALELRRRRFDTAIVLNPHKILHLACFLAGIPRRVGYNRKFGMLLTDSIKDSRNSGEKHEIEYTMDLLDLLGVKIEDPSPHLVIRTDAEKKVKELLLKLGIEELTVLIAVHPGTSNPAKMWPAEEYAGLISRLRSELNYKIVIIGSSGESALAKSIINMSDTDQDIIDLTGKLDLYELSAFLNLTSLFIGNDTGPMHMAAAVNTPVIAIFGRNMPGVSPVRWRPWGDENIVFHEDPGCDPCYDADCPYEYKCLTAITVDAVFKAAKGILSKVPSE